jgi:enoyl-CoA hydratase/carnithine racemase
MTAPGPSVVVTVAERIATVRMARPERRNALSRALMHDLTAALAATGARDDVAVIVIEGEGPAFSAGHDLAELGTADNDELAAIFAACVEMMTLVHQLPQPVIAKVRGVATAAGCQLVAACDLAVCTESARFATPGVNIGLFCSTPMVPLSRSIGRKHALEMLLTGEMIDAATAERWGLVNRVVPEEALDDAVTALAHRIAAASADVVAIGKRAFYEQIDLDEAHAYEHTAPVMIANAQHPDAREGIRAFLDKRVPRWQGR